MTNLRDCGASILWSVALVALPSLGLEARAEPSSEAAAAVVTPPGLRLDAYVESHYTYALQRPRNRVIAERGFDNRHASFALSNAVLGVVLDDNEVYGRLALQVGVTPATYYQAEPSFAGQSGAGPADATLWRHVQEAYGGWRVPYIPGLALEMGLFLSPIGIEALAIRDSWQWSRSNLFFGSPFYHTGVRLHQRLADNLTASLGVFNGWNSVIDNNASKSINLRLGYEGRRAQAAVLYFGGRERSLGDPHGNPWRHLLDAWASAQALPWLETAFHVNAGGERSLLGATRWLGLAGYARIAIHDTVTVAGRSDVFFEKAPTNALGERSAIFWNADRISSQTTTLSWWAHRRVRFMLEHRFDAASAPLFYRGQAEQPNTRKQNTVTMGMVLNI